MTDVKRMKNQYVIRLKIIKALVKTRACSNVLWKTIKQGKYTTKPRKSGLLLLTI